MKKPVKKQAKDHKIIKKVIKKAPKKTVKAPVKKTAEKQAEIKKSMPIHHETIPQQPLHPAAKQTPPLGREFRPWVIWIWNQSITKSELIKQLRFFIDKRFSGIAIKIGRDMTPAFLSEEFFKLFNEVLSVAQKEKIGIRLA